ncbi:Conserved_hypothetical protein [Hexamita inflata]|uniref:Uncharacterized protein n=1 Tax=Hexamita inflata TaxID=28002 RepID=A0AA86Q8F5_9EUKA|nr:Conserved hypothetical protein [Hexamita inflata]
MTELPVLNNKVFVPHQKWQYIVKQYEYNQNTPCCMDVIDTDLPLYNEYYDLMKKRVTKYSKLQYVLLTKNSANQILWFVKKFPFFQKIVNVVYLTKEMESIICAQQLPFCFILNQKQHIVYRGPISTENYFSTISYLNELKSNQSQDFHLSFFKADSLNLQNRQLSLAMSGLQQKPVTQYQKPISLNMKSIKPNLSFMLSNDSISNSSFSSIDLNIVAKSAQQTDINDFVQQLNWLSLPNNSVQNIKIAKTLKRVVQHQKDVQNQSDEWD